MVSNCSATKSLNTGRLTAGGIFYPPLRRRWAVRRQTGICSRGGQPKPVTVLLGWQGSGSLRCSWQSQKTFADRVNLDPLAESENLESFRGFMSEDGVPDESVAATMGLFATRQFAAVAREQSPAPQSLKPLGADEVVMDEVPGGRQDKRRKSENTHVQQSGGRSEEGPLRSESFPSAWTLCVCLREERHTYSTSAGRVFVCLVSTTLGFVMLETRCHLGASFIKSAACARRLAPWTELKEAQAGLKQIFVRTKIDR